MRCFLLALLCCFPLLAQQNPPTVPDCFIQIVGATATGATSTAAGGQGDNRGLFCVDWTITVQFQGFSAASVQLESAPDNNGVAGAWTVFAGTVVTGTNPLASFTQKAGSATVSGFFPWIRINVTSLTGVGTITAMASGFRPIAFTVLKTAATASNITQIGGLAVSACNSQALFNFSGTGNAQLIAASASNRILICHYDVAFASAVDFKLTYGTGANCVTGTTDLTGLKKSIVTDAQDYGPFSPLVVPASQALCGNSSASVAGGLTIVYAQIP
jgi:hypothetical protein